MEKERRVHSPLGRAHARSDRSADRRPGRRRRGGEAPGSRPGTTSTTTYDNLNRPVTTSDGKGSQTHSYDPTTGQLTSLADSHAGTFTAWYDADGRVVSKTYPNGMKADTTYDPAGAPVGLKYTKTSNCSTNCVWIDEQVSESIHGQWRTHSWDLSSQEYTYDKAGRLTKVQDDVESPGVIAGCTIRSYSFDQNSNRTAVNVQPMDANGACQPGIAGTTQSYTHDGADRLTGSGIDYDKFGRMTNIPAIHSGGGALSYTYYTNDQVHSISQDGITKTYTLDPAGRQRQIATAGSTTETLHYRDSSDSSTWSRTTNSQGQETRWERNIEGIDGDLAAIRTHNAQGDTTVLQLQNLHGDIIATASTDPNATALTARFESDEFGNPRQASAGRYGWLGGKQRRTELASGVIQMGVRSYVPSLGRFTSVDQVEGGSATDYDYANADPVNQMDLTGLFSCKVKATTKLLLRTGDDTRRYRVRFTFRCSGTDVTQMKNVIGIRRHNNNWFDEQVYGPETRNCYRSQQRTGTMNCGWTESYFECTIGQTYIAHTIGRWWYGSTNPGDEGSLKLLTDSKSDTVRWRC